MQDSTSSIQKEPSQEVKDTTQSSESSASSQVSQEQDKKSERSSHNLLYSKVENLFGYILEEKSIKRYKLLFRQLNEYLYDSDIAWNLQEEVSLTITETGGEQII